MSLQKLMHNYAGYDVWANRTLAAWVAIMPTASISAEVASSFPSIAKTLAHIRDTEKFWLGILKGYPSQKWEEFTGADPGVVHALLLQSQELCDHVCSLDEPELLDLCTLHTHWVQGQLPKYEFIQHCFNHSTYHRGQVITIARSLGFTDPPNTDYNYYNMMRK